MTADTGHPLLYLDGAVRVRSNTIFWPANDDYALPGNDLVDFANAGCPLPQVVTLNAADRAIIDQVKSVVPPPASEHVAWFRVSPGEQGYDLLPDHGLVVVYDKQGEQDALAGNHPVYVLYYAGEVHLDSNVVYKAASDRYLNGVANPVSFADEGGR